MISQGGANLSFDIIFAKKLHENEKRTELVRHLPHPHPKFYCVDPPLALLVIYTTTMDHAVVQCDVLLTGSWISSHRVSNDVVNGDYDVTLWSQIRRTQTKWDGFFYIVKIKLFKFKRLNALLGEKCNGFSAQHSSKRNVTIWRDDDIRLEIGNRCHAGLFWLTLLSWQILGKIKRSDSVLNKS